MKNIIIIMAVLCFIQQSVQAQNSDDINLISKEINTDLISHKEKRNVQAVPSKLKRQSETNLFVQSIQSDLENRTALFLATKELNPLFTEKYGTPVNITSENIVAHLLKISRDTLQAISIRREAILVLFGKLPDGHVFEETK